MAWLDKEVTRNLISLLNIPKSAPLVWNLAWDKRIPWSRKTLFLGGALAYFLMPYDFVPDWIPLFGQLDDLLVLFLLVERFVAGTPDSIINQYR